MPKSRHCWFHKSSHGHVLAAEELAVGFNKMHLEGKGKAQVFEGKDFREKIVGKKEIIFFKDY